MGHPALKNYAFCTIAATCATQGVSAAATEFDSTSRVAEIRGAAASTRFGRPILCADLDNDGRDELILSADVGNKLFILRGRADLSDWGLIDLATATADVEVRGDTGAESFASALAKGDLNHDGIDDLVALDPEFTPSGRTGAGAGYVLFGRSNFFSVSFYDFAAGDWDVKFLGAAAGENTGGSTLFGGGVSHGVACGDIDNDGIDDVAIGAHLADGDTRTDNGAVRVFRGPFTHGTTKDMASQANYTVFGAGTFDELGKAIVIGDWDGDSIDDLIMGDNYASIGTFTSEGRVYVMKGRTSFPAVTTLRTQNGDYRITGEGASDELGEIVALGDIDGDSKLDLIAGAGAWDPAHGSNDNFGAYYGLRGGVARPAAMSLTTTTPETKILGYSDGQSIGQRLTMGDLNGDGKSDIVFGTRDGGRAGFTGEGRAFVVYGAATLQPSRSLQLEEVDVIFNGGAAGMQMVDFAATGDPDGDGADELIVSSPFLDSSKGRVFVFDLTPPPAAAQGWMLYH